METNFGAKFDDLADPTFTQHADIPKQIARSHYFTKLHCDDLTTLCRNVVKFGRPTVNPEFTK